MSVDINKAWIETVSGKQFHILDPRAEEISIEDIGHALGMLCRFTGQCRKFYSVAEHCVHVSRLVPSPDALWGLMHDASEAYISDLNRPMKHFTSVGPTYKATERKIMTAICDKFRLPQEEPPVVKDADNSMLLVEKDQLMTALAWDTNWVGTTKAADVQVRCWSPEIAKVEYLHRFYELTNQL